MIKRHLFITGIVLASITISLAQSDYRPGYIITNDQVRVEGLIAYSEGKSQYRVCAFKENKKSPVKKYYPNEIASYRIDNDKYYVSRVVEVENGVKKSSFLQVLIQGEIALLKEDQSYYVEKNTIFIELKNTQRTKVNNEGSFVGDSYEYVGTLNYLFSDCEGFNYDLMKVGINERSLINVFDFYYKCIGSAYTTYKEEKEWLKTKFDIEGGLVNSKLEFSYLKSLGVTSTMYSELSLNPSFGSTLLIHSPRVNERVAFQLKLLFIPSKYNIYFSEDFGNSSVENDIFINLLQANIPFGFRYTYLTNCISPYIGGGFTTTFNISPDFKRTSEVQTQNEVRTFVSYEQGFKSIQFGGWLELGARGHIISGMDLFLSLRYEITNGFFDNVFTPVQQILDRSRVYNLYYTLGIVF
jgi:hypothetical protein